MTNLLLGPLLGLESDSNYTVCFLTDKEVVNAHVEWGGELQAAERIADLRTGSFWRAELLIPPPGVDRLIAYRVMTNGIYASDRNAREAWEFHVPAANSQPNIVYTSCNGFSSASLATTTEEPFAMWHKLKAAHTKSPFSLMIMGGDQVYADEIWGRVSELRKWVDLPLKKRVKRNSNRTMRRQIENFYEGLYQTRWNSPDMSEMLASVPSVMMWDDHDIFDGWGSHPEKLQKCEIHKEIFRAARRYFELFQIRSAANRSLLAPGTSHFAFSLTHRQQRILALDHRSERTRKQIMSDAQWKSVITHLEEDITDGDLLVLSAVPVVYRDFSFAEAVMDATPWEEELTDDLKDHWRSKQHEGERARLIMRLLENVRQRGVDARQRGADVRTVILSGDVHVGCVGVINDRRNEPTHKIHQIVSSGIIHPAPSRTQWLGILATTNDDTEHLNEDETIEINLLRPFGADKYLRSRNFLTLKQGNDEKLWATWVCESGKCPAFPLA